MPRARNQLTLDLDRIKDTDTREVFRVLLGHVNELIAKGLDTDGSVRAKTFQNHDSLFTVDKTGKVLAKSFACFGTAAQVAAGSPEIPTYFRVAVREGTLGQSGSRTLTLPETSGARVLGAIGWSQIDGDRLTDFTFVDADVSVADDTITEAAHGLTDGMQIAFSNSGGALPTGITAGNIYYVRDALTNTFKISTTRGGSARDITAAAGGGTHTAQAGDYDRFVPMGYGAASTAGSCYFVSATTASKSNAVRITNDSADFVNAYRVLIFYTDDQ